MPDEQQTRRRGSPAGPGSRGERRLPDDRRQAGIEPERRQHVPMARQTGFREPIRNGAAHEVPAAHEEGIDDDGCFAFVTRTSRRQICERLLERWLSAQHAGASPRKAPAPHLVADTEQERIVATATPLAVPDDEDGRVRGASSPQWLVPSENVILL